MLKFSEKELFCLARHLMAQHYENTYLLTHIALCHERLEHYKKEKEKRELTKEEKEKADVLYQQLMQSKRAYKAMLHAFNGGLIFPRKTDDKPLCCCETCPNKVACVKTSNEEYTDIGTLKSFSSNGSIMEEIKEKLKPFIKENLKCL